MRVRLPQVDPNQASLLPVAVAVVASNSNETKTTTKRTMVLTFPARKTTRLKRTIKKRKSLFDPSRSALRSCPQDLLEAHPLANLVDRLPNREELLLGIMTMKMTLIAAMILAEEDRHHGEVALQRAAERWFRTQTNRSEPLPVVLPHCARHFQILALSATLPCRPLQQRARQVPN
jgi:hypothetical protein